MVDYQDHTIFMMDVFDIKSSWIIRILKLFPKGSGWNLLQVRSTQLSLSNGKLKSSSWVSRFIMFMGLLLCPLLLSTLFHVLMSFHSCVQIACLILFGCSSTMVFTFAKQQLFLIRFLLIQECIFTVIFMGNLHAF